MGKFKTVNELVNSLKPDYPVYCIRLNEIKKSVNFFKENFPGKILYAVKTNPNEKIIKQIIANGINEFDVASLNEIKLINKIYLPASVGPLLNKKKINYINSKIENIRIIKGTNFDYFSDEAKKIFLEKEYTVSKLSDRMGMRLEGPKIENIVNTNIKSEGLLKGVIQVPADGNPIIMLSDHGTIGGYPKIAVVASVDYDRLVQISPGSKIKFKEIELSDAETLFKLYEMETQNLLSQI